METVETTFLAENTKWKTLGVRRYLTRAGFEITIDFPSFSESLPTSTGYSFLDL